MAKVKGNLQVKRIVSSTRSDQSFIDHGSITESGGNGRVVLNKNSAYWNRVKLQGGSSPIAMGDAQLMELGTSFVIENPTTNSFGLGYLGGQLSVYNASGSQLFDHTNRQVKVLADESIQLTLVKNDTANGEWHVERMGYSGNIVNSRLVFTIQRGDFVLTGDYYEFRKDMVIYALPSTSDKWMAQYFSFENQGAPPQFVGNIDAEAVVIEGTSHQAGQAALSVSATQTIQFAINTYNANPTNISNGHSLTLISGNGAYVVVTGASYGIGGGTAPSGAYIRVHGEEERLETDDDVSIRVSAPDLESPDTDGRFEGKILIL